MNTGKWLIVFALLIMFIGLGTTQASAAINSVNNNFTMINGIGGLTNGTNDVVFTWNATKKTSVAASGQVSNAQLVSTCPFFGLTWAAHDMAIYGPGTYTVFDGCPAGSPGCGTGNVITFTVLAGQLGVHMLFDWGGNNDIDVVNVWVPNAVFGPSAMCADENNCGGQETCGSNPAGTAWSYMSSDWDGDGSNGAPMTDGPFAGFNANFNVNTVGTVNNNLTILDSGNGLTGGSNDILFTWNGTRKTSVAVSGQVSNAVISSTCPFFGVTQTFHDVAIYGPGTYTVYTGCPAGSPGCGTGIPITFTVGTGEIGGHILYDWMSAVNYDIVNVWQPKKVFGPSSLYTGPDCGTGNPAQVWDWMSKDIDGNGINGIAMLEGCSLDCPSSNFNLMGVPPGCELVDCNDNNACTIDGCNTATGACVHTATVPASCNDNNICTTDGCSTATGLCTHTATVPAECDDNNVCTTDTCANNTCRHSPIVNCCTSDAMCDDNNVCTTDTCDLKNIRCVFTAPGTCPIYTGRNNFTMIDPTGKTIGGQNDVVFAWDGSKKTSVAASGQISNAVISSTCPFPGLTWSTHDVAVYGPGTYTVYAGCAAGSPGCGTGAAIPFTVGAGQLGAHMLFDWGTSRNIDVVNIWNPNAVFAPSALWTGSCKSQDATKVWDLMSSDWDENGINGRGMVDGPFFNFHANFNLNLSMPPCACTSPGYCNDNNACTTDTCDMENCTCVHKSISCDDNNACTSDTCDPATSCIHVAQDRSGIITTVAGYGQYGFSGDNGPALSASFRSVYSVAVDQAGNIYIADSGNHRIRKVDTSGIVTTVAGNGTTGYSGDNGSATSASLNSPGGVAVDLSGNIFIADYYNHRIRKVDTSGIITTVAGNGTTGYSGDNGPAVFASLNFPGGVAVDSSGNIYIADRDNQRIRKVDISGTITTVAGNGTGGFSGDNGPATAARLFGPADMAVDSLGNIYIADRINNRIRRVDTSGIINTVAGNGTYGYSGDNGPATASSLRQPESVAVDSSGNIYIADSSSYRIRRVDTSGIITTVAGNGYYVYIGDNIPATSASLNLPASVAVDSSANIYIADTGNYRIRKVTWSICTPCAGQPDGTPCSDNNACTTDDVCSNGSCAGTPTNCNDNNACTADSCDTMTGCVYVPISCDDNNICTLDGCNTATGCTHTATVPPQCDDNNICTTDNCITATGQCTHSSFLTPAACNDNNACTLDGCTNNACTHTPVICDDGIACTTGTCNTSTGCIYTPSCPITSYHNNFTMNYPDGRITGGTNDVVFMWDGTKKTSVAVSGQVSNATLSSTTPFFSIQWTMYDVAIYGPGTYTVYTACPAGSPGCGQFYYDLPPITFTVGAGQLGAHMLFDYGGATAHDVVNVWMPNSVFGPSPMFTGPDGTTAPFGNTATVWSLMSSDWDGDGVNGSPMVTGAFQGFNINFNLNYVGTINNNFTMNNPGGGLTGGANDVIFTWNGTRKTSVAVSGQVSNATLSSTCPFYGVTWSANDVAIYGPGTYTVYTNCGPGSPGCGSEYGYGIPITFTVGSGELGVHLLFEWGGAIRSNVVNVWSPKAVFGPSPMYSGPDCGTGDPARVWDWMSKDIDADGINGMYMIEGAMAGFSMNFNVMGVPPGCSTATDCDDNNACTVDTCFNGGCIHTARVCNDNNACTTDTCNTATGCVHTPIVCDDNNICTTDTCNMATGCVYTLDLTLPGCSSFENCFLAEIRCNDNNACTADSCIPGMGPGTGCIHTPIVCNDNEFCTVDSCNTATGCVFEAACGIPDCAATPLCYFCITDTSCLDNNACTTDKCNTATGKCSNTPFVCSDNNACTTETCYPTTGCVSSPMPCNDNNACTNDTCNTVTGCVFTPKNIDDNNKCTIDACDPATGLITHTPISCSDNNACTDDRCDPNSGVCVYVVPDCSDNNACTRDWCDPVLGCRHEPIICNDNNACTTDACSPIAGCFSTPIVCNDNNACTTDICVASTGCVFTPRVCNDNNVCTADSCNSATGVCVFTPVADGTACGSAGMCQSGTCQTGKCPKGSYKKVTLKGTGSSYWWVENQIMTEFMVKGSGCILRYTASTLTATPGTVLKADWKEGIGPNPTSVTWKGVSVPAKTNNYTITCPSKTGAVGDLVLNNLGARHGKDTETLTVSVATN